MDAVASEIPTPRHCDDGGGVSVALRMLFERLSRQPER